MAPFPARSLLALASLLLVSSASAKPPTTSAKMPSNTAKRTQVVDLSPEPLAKPSAKKRTKELKRLGRRAKFDPAALKAAGWVRDDPFLSTRDTLKDESKAGALWTVFNRAELVTQDGAVFPNPAERDASLEVVFETEEKGDFVISCTAQAFFDDGPFEITVSAKNRPDQVVDPRFSVDLLVHANKPGIYEWTLKGNLRWTTTRCTASRMKRVELHDRVR